MFYIIYIIIFITNALSLQMKSAYLSSTQWKSINSLIQNPSLTPLMRNNIHKVIYNCYENYALKSAIKFKKIHKHTCKNIKLDELKLYSKFGLYRAIENYNGSYSFTNYMNKYINGELYRGLTELYPLSGISKSNRRNLKGCKDDNKLVRLFTKFVSYENNWMFDKYYRYQQYQEYEEQNNASLQKIIYMEYKNHLFQFVNNNLDAFSKRVFYYRYDIDYNIVRSNKDISKLMGCSEEKIRQTIIHIKSIIRDFF